MNRETYLNAAARLMRPIFASAGAPIPSNVRISVGFPKGRRGGNGQCWSTACSADGTFEIFVSPELDEVTRVLDVLAHELVHAAVGLEHGHKGEFARVARAIGLEGKLTSTVAGAELKARLSAIVAELGAFPGAALRVSGDGSSGPKKQSTRLVKCACGECGYVMRTARTWLDTLGAPLCPCNGEPMEVAA